MPGRYASTTTLVIVLLLETAAIVAFSQTGKTYTQDEGYHLVASQLINAGKRPYIDFFYPQAPLYVYFNAYWMRLFGQSWQTAHAFSALLTAATMAAVAIFIHKRLRERRLAFSLLSTIPFILNPQILYFGTIAQPFGIALFLGFVSFWLAIRALEESKPILEFVAGLAAGLAAASTFWSLPVVLVLTFWIIWTGRAAGFRLFALFLFGSMIPFLPVIYWMTISFRPVLFGMFEYHVFHRSLTEWGTEAMLSWKFKVLAQWLFSPNIFLVILAVICVVHWRLHHKSRRESHEDPKWYQNGTILVPLVAWISLAAALYALIPHPTFPQYFLFLIPYLSILSIFCISQARIKTSMRAMLVTGFVFAFLLGTVRFLVLESKKPFSEWKVVDELAHAVNLARSGEPLYAWEAVYFAADRIPPSGLENYFGAKLHVSPALASKLHLLSEEEINRRLAAGSFDTVVISAVDPRVNALDLASIYSIRKEVTKETYRKYYILLRRTAG